MTQNYEFKIGTKISLKNIFGEHKAYGFVVDQTISAVYVIYEDNLWLTTKHPKSDFHRIELV